MDRQEVLVEQVRDAIDAGVPLAPSGGGSKAFYGLPGAAHKLDLSGHGGVVEYDPGELVITCRAGSLLTDISDVLDENGQYFPFEPPAFGSKATIGGTVACGFSGPGRPWTGSLRDYLLGVRLINGRGEVVRYGGQVMKNVAGYDISRLMAGSMGTLGAILEVSFKVLPRPSIERTLQFACSQEEAIRRCNRWSGQPLPLSAACWHGENLWVRLSGAASGVERAGESMRADRVLDDPSFWTELREHRTGFFRQEGDLWRLSLPPATAPLNLDGEVLLDWGGAQRWYVTDTAAEIVREQAARAGGHATLFRGSSTPLPFHPLPAPLRSLHRRIKQALDPNGIFNPGRMYADW
jgi:glycolate oxidase FAD binding subunit